MLLFSEQKPSSDLSSVVYWRLHVDGASRNNPGPAGAGIVLLKNEHVLEEHGYYLGVKTNNQAEYMALILGLCWLKQHTSSQDIIQIISDSQLLVRQLEGAYKVKHPDLKPLFQCAQNMLRGLNYSIAHVMREENVEADKLANEGIDKKIPIPESFLTQIECYEQMR